MSARRRQRQRARPLSSSLVDPRASTPPGASFRSTHLLGTRRGTAGGLTLLLGALLLPQTVLASDHVDGPLTTAHPITDLTDLYAFPSPGRPGYLSLVLNAYPMVPSTGHFSDKLRYEFLLRAARPRGPEGAPGFATAGSYTIRCSFDTPHRVFARHRVRCESSAGASAEAEVDAVQAAQPEERMRVFAGQRSDPFFINTAFFTELSQHGRLLEPMEANGLEGMNVLTLALEIDLAREGLKPGLLAIAAQATTTDHNGEVRRLDRLGRPEVTNILMAAREGPDLRPLYNADEPFLADSPRRPEYRAQLQANIDGYDKADGSAEWSESERDALAELILDDYLVINLSRACRTATFLEIERSLLFGAETIGCGGRSLDDDVVDELYTLLVHRGEGPRIRDGVDRATQPSSDLFPYLAPPNRGAYPALLAFIQRNGARLQSHGPAFQRGLMSFAAAVFALLAGLAALLLALRSALGRARGRPLSRRSKGRTFAAIALLLGLAAISVVASGSSSIRAPALLALGSAVALALGSQQRDPAR